MAIAAAAWTHRGRFALAALLGSCSALAAAQAYPTKPIRFIVGYPPGGSSDLVARLYAPRLTQAFGQQVIVDNRPGANGIIGRELVARATPDGYTMTVLGPSTLVMGRVMQRVPYDPMREFAPVARVAESQNILIVHPGVPARTLEEYIAYARSRSGRVNYATSGVGGAGHLAAELMRSMTGIDIVHVPYKGGGLAINELLAGQIESFMAVITTAVPHVQSGKARAIAVTGARRSAALPDVPTMAQSGLAGYDATTWYGFVVPAATPRAIVDRLHAAIIGITREPATKQALESRGLDVYMAGPDELGAYMRTEAVKWTNIVRAAGLKQDP